jgi:prepilin-type N-terminal cleavage/methylation domain-containing protein
MKKTSKRQGFTLIELLVVISIIAILATVVFVALDPVTRFADARNSRRWNDVNSLLTAVHSCIVDNDGSLSICGISGTSSQVLGTGGLNISTQMAPYLKSMPQDPSTGTTADTGYSLQPDSNNMITITADDAENSEVIQVSR